MNIITEPTVLLVSVPHFIDHPRYVLPGGGTDSERLITHAGKGCYDSYGHDGRAIDLHVHGLISSGHGSVLEHANVSVFIEGISRGCSHEIVRHRAGFAYSQRSTRYTREDDASIVLDHYFADLWYRADQLDVDEAAILNTFVQQAEKDFVCYRNLVEWLMEVAPPERPGTERRKWARGKARQALPHALETRMTMTGNLRAWRHFLVQRSGEGAEPEIRRLAEQIYLTIAPIAPLVFEDLWADGKMYEGFPVYTSNQPKV